MVGAPSRPHDADALRRRAHALRQQGRLNEAEAEARERLARRPGDVDAWDELAQTLLQQGRPDDAAAAWRQLIVLQPGDAAAHSNLSVALKNLGRLAAAEAAARQAIALQPTFAAAHANLALVLKRAGRLAEAEATGRQALALQPGRADVLSNLAITVLEAGRPGDALELLHQALAADPSLLAARSNRLFVAQQCSPLPADANRWARDYGDALAAGSGAACAAWRCTRRPSRLRVGLVSGDLRAHPVGWFLLGTLARLGAHGIDAVGLPTHHAADAVTRELQAHCSSWLPLVGLDDRQAAARVEAAGVHVLIDLAGHTAHHRLPLFALRPAPVQASWLGYFGSTGVAQIDHLIADPVSVPPGAEGEFTEHVVRLPHSRLCFTPPADAPPVAPLPALRNGFVTFGSFQGLAKVGTPTLALWRRVLDAVPRSRLRLQSKALGDDATTAELRERLVAQGIDAARVDLHGPMPRPAYLAAHAEVDVLLDTKPFPGGTTTCEALWMGVPTLTLAGTTMLGRQGASLLCAAGLADWVAADDAGYVARAVAAAADPAGLAALRHGLRERVAASPLFDAERFARDLAGLLWRLWHDFESREAGAAGPDNAAPAAPRPALRSTDLPVTANPLPGNAAVLYRPEGFDTGRDKLMGRHAASEGFLKGLVRHGRIDKLYCYAPGRDMAEHFHRLVGGFGNQRPVHWLDEADAASPRAAGALYLPDPSLAAAAWRRRAVGQRAYSITGITHTTASAGAMDWIAGLLTAPVQPWDALICTSAVVRDTVERVLLEQQEYLARRLGAGSFVRPVLPVIPLGVDTTAYAPDPAQRDAARRALGIGEHDVVVLFVGRLSFHAKAHPLPMYLGLEQAAQAWARQAGGKVHLVQAGWFANEAIETAFRSGAATFCPSVACTFVDGRKPDARQMAWRSADLFTSLSDNFQETFGLTPIEAMAAGLPGVVSDWNGYRDTVRDGVDGLRVPTLMPRAGLAGDLADRHAAGIDSYDVYCGSSSQFVAIAPDAAAAAYLRLISDAALRRRLGDAARQRALEVFDWRVVIGRYQDLWAELAERRAAADESAAPRAGQPPNPSRLDPFLSFASYASDTLSPAHVVRAAPGADAARLRGWLASPLLAYMQRAAPDTADVERLLAELAQRGPLTVAELLAATPEARRGRVERGLVWLAKLGMVTITHGSERTNAE
jgi:predicted O-linked N-acetylglucosamine transferase (SPINDLY family)